MNRDYLEEVGSMKALIVMWYLYLLQSKSTDDSFRKFRKLLLNQIDTFWNRWHSVRVANCRLG